MVLFPGRAGVELPAPVPGPGDVCLPGLVRRSVSPGPGRPGDLEGARPQWQLDRWRRRLGLLESAQKINDLN